jgi:AraC-like DNA-binding protein
MPSIFLDKSNMQENPINIKFQNRQNPNAEFDIINIEDLLNRDHHDHSPFHLHRVDFYMIMLIEKGEGIHTIDFTELKFKKGSILTIRKDQIHKFHENDSVKGKLLLFTDEFLVSYLEELEALKSLQLFNEIIGVPKLHLSKKQLKSVVKLVKRIEKEYFKVSDEYSLGIIRSELHVLLAKLYRIKSSNNQIISSRKYLSEFIEFQNLVEQNAKQYTQVQDYAPMMGVSTKTLNTITKTIVNKTAKAFVDDICTKQIKRLLINTDLTVKEIAYSSGFEETTNFYKYFKRQTQLTPEQFRSSFR